MTALELPATSTVSSWTPGICWMRDHTSREVGISVSAAPLKVRPVSTWRVSRRAGASVTVTLSWTDASLIATSTSVFRPTETITFSRLEVAKFGVVTVSVYLPGAIFGNRNRPRASTAAVRGAAEPVRVAVPTGIGEPSSSMTVP